MDCRSDATNDYTFHLVFAQQPGGASMIFVGNGIGWTDYADGGL